MENRPNERDRIEQLVKKHANELGEHVDSVRIFVTYHEGDQAQTAAFSFGAGNHYAALGQVWDWLNAKRAQTHFEQAPGQHE